MMQPEKGSLSAPQRLSLWPRMACFFQFLTDAWMKCLFRSYYSVRINLWHRACFLQADFPWSLDPMSSSEDSGAPSRDPGNPQSESLWTLAHCLLSSAIAPNSSHCLEQLVFHGTYFRKFHVNVFPYFLRVNYSWSVLAQAYFIFMSLCFIVLFCLVFGCDGSSGCARAFSS